MVAEKSAPYVLVIGSSSVDVSALTATLPKPGETVIGHRSIIGVGGKGANQAVAAAACGATTDFVGRVGPDSFGQMVRDGLAARNVGIGEIRTIADAATGLAVIFVEDSSQNCIIVVSGANARIEPADVDAVLPLIRGAAVVVLQCEIPMESVYRAIELAAASRIPVILNPAPFRGLDLARIAKRVTYLIPNETEASQMYGKPVETVEQAESCAAWIHAQGIECVIITLGAQGCLVRDERPGRHVSGHRVPAIDTTGAGDAFVGCLAASLATGHSRDESVRRAVLYSAMSTTRPGAQVSYPDRQEFERAWTNHVEKGPG